MKKVVSHGENMDLHGRYDFGFGIAGTGLLLPKDAADKIKEEKERIPVTSNTLANFRNFQLQK